MPDLSHLCSDDICECDPGFPVLDRVSLTGCGQCGWCPYCHRQIKGCLYDQHTWSHGREQYDPYHPDTPDVTPDTEMEMLTAELGNTFESICEPAPAKSNPDDDFWKELGLL